MTRVLLIVPIAIGTHSVAQTTPPPSFEVATVKSMDGKNPHPPSVMISGDRFQATGMTLKELVKISYDLNYGADRQISGGPAWIESARFDIEAADLVLVIRTGILSVNQACRNVYINATNRINECRQTGEIGRHDVIDRDTQRRRDNLTRQIAAAKGIGGINLAVTITGNIYTQIPRYTDIGHALTRSIKTQNEVGIRQVLTGMSGVTNAENQNISTAATVGCQRVQAERMF